MHNIRFLLGDYAEKRKYLRESANYAYADNEEVEGVIRISGKDYFFLSAHPFGDFTTLQYLSYCRALVNYSPMTKHDMSNLCAMLGINLSPNKKLKSYSVLQRRLISLAASYKPGCEFRINLDGFGYTRRRKRQLKKIAKRLAIRGKVTIAVSDTRFVFKHATAEYIKSGYIVAAVRRVKTCAVSRRRVRRLLKATRNGLPVPVAKEIICCSPAPV